MARRGYFEGQGDNFRLRIVKPGFDADNPNISPNNVIIDSGALGVLSILDSGLGVVPNWSVFSDGIWIATWNPLPYPPLCNLMYGPGSSTMWFSHIPEFISDHHQQVRVTTTGIYMRQVVRVSSGGGGYFPLRVRWTTYRLPVTL